MAPITGSPSPRSSELVTSKAKQPPASSKLPGVPSRQVIRPRATERRSMSSLPVASAATTSTGTVAKSSVATALKSSAGKLTSPANAPMPPSASAVTMPCAFIR